MVKVFHTIRNSLLPIFIALTVFVYPILARAACPCPEMTLSPVHAPIHKQQVESQNVAEQKPCHGGHATALSSPISERQSPKKQSDCCTVRAADFELFKMDLSLTANKLQLENKFLQFAVLPSYSSQYNPVPAYVYQHYASKPRWSISENPIYIWHQAFLI